MNEQQEPNKGGAPKGNLNALKTGARSKQLAKLERYGMILGRLSKDHEKLYRYVSQYRRRLEAEVRRAYGSVTSEQAHLIDAATKQQMLGLFAAATIRKSKVLTYKDELQLIKAQADAALRRNVQVAKLKLSQSPNADWAFHEDQTEQNEDG